MTEFFARYEETGKITAGPMEDGEIYSGIDEDSRFWPVVQAWAQKGNQVQAFIPPGPASVDVDTERDRRIAAGFTYAGKLFQARQFDLDNIRSMATAASVKIVQGAQDGDLRWFDPNNDFYWIAADNTTMPMSAPDMVEFAMTAAAWGSKHILAGAALKSMSPIPTDFANNKWWP